MALHAECSEPRGRRKRSPIPRLEGRYLPALTLTEFKHTKLITRKRWSDSTVLSMCQTQVTGLYVDFRGSTLITYHAVDPAVDDRTHALRLNPLVLRLTRLTGHSTLQQN